MINFFWPDSLISPVESSSCHKGFPLDLKDQKMEELPPIFFNVWSDIENHAPKLGFEILI